MRVLVICGAGIVSGKEIMSLHLLRELKEKGHTCFCIVSTWGSEDFRNRLRTMEIQFTNLRIGFISKTLNWSAIRMTLVQLFHLPMLWVRYSLFIHKIQPDIVLHTNFHHFFILYPLLNKSGNIYWSHEVIGNTRFYKWLFRLFEKKTDVFVAVSNAAAISLKRFILRKEVKVIKNGIIVSQRNVEDHKKTEVFNLAIVGQVSNPKGHEVLFKALEGIPKDRYVLRIIGLGSEQYVSFLKDLAIQLGIESNCRWLGYIKDIDVIYSGIDILIVPSIFADPFPTTVMEAGVRGIPVIGSTSGGLPEMIEDGANGFLFDSGNEILLRDAIVKAMDKSVFDVLRRRTAHFAQERFRMERFANDFETLIVSV